MSSQTLFVFYTLLKPVSWTYGKFPQGWVWTGSGFTNPLNGKKLKYEREEQFNGTQKNQDKMKDYLDRYFKKLKEKGVVQFYKIRGSYKP
jgi:hypothetical protein